MSRLAVHGKECSKCGAVKWSTDFYKGAAKCKECVKAAVKARYVEKRDEIAAYERKRNRDPARRAKAAQYQRNAKNRHPEKRAARVAVGNAVRDGRLLRKPCEVCDDPKSQAHHEDYSKPLDVRWLCFKCHREHEHGQTVTATGAGSEAA